MNRSSKSKRRIAFVSIALMLVLAIMGTSVFLTARDDAEDKFATELTEPSRGENNKSLVTLSFMNEDGDIINTETIYAGTPVEMYFESSLAKDGYTFDWVNKATSEVAYSGMPMPEEDMTLTATYTATGYSAEASDYLKYRITLDADGNPCGVLVGADTTSANYPTELTAIVVPNFIEVTRTDSGDYLSPDAASVIPMDAVGNNISTGTFTLPITTVDTAPGSGLYEIMETLVIGDSITAVETLDRSDSGDYTTENNICKNVILPYGMKTIGNQTFCNFTALESVNLPNSLTYIGDMAFEYCAALTTIDMPKGVSYCQTNGSQFAYCTALTTATINSDIPKNCFENCASLSDVTIENGVTSIDRYAFEKCTGLTSVTIPNGVTSIGSYAFFNCTGLTSVIFGENSQLTNIGNYAFSLCSGLTSIEIPDSVMSIGNSAFSGCHILTSITIGNSVTTIGDDAFSGCTGLTNITIPNSVTTIGDYAFDNCIRLTSIIIPDSVTSIGSWAFLNCFELANAKIGNSVTNIGDYAFAYCTGLTSITIPDSVTNIGDYAFYSARITEVSIPSGCTVGTNAFRSSCTITYR